MEGDFSKKSSLFGDLGWQPTFRHSGEVIAEFRKVAFVGGGILINVGLKREEKEAARAKIRISLNACYKCIVRKQLGNKREPSFSYLI